MIQTLIDNYEDNNDIYNLNKDKKEIKIVLEDKNKKEIQDKECNIDDEDKTSYSDINDEDKYCSFNTIRKSISYWESKRRWKLFILYIKFYYFRY